MSKSTAKKPVPIFAIVKDIVIAGLSIVAIVVSIKTCSKQEESNLIAEEANKIAKSAMESSAKFDIITAETQWAALKDSYDETDQEVLDWENNKGLKRDGQTVKSEDELVLVLDRLKVPPKIRRLYIKRHEKYEILKNVADQYKPFQERLANVDFVLPSAPVLPRVTLSGVTIRGGVSIR